MRVLAADDNGHLKSVHVETASLATARPSGYTRGSALTHLRLISDSAAYAARLDGRVARVDLAAPSEQLVLASDAQGEGANDGTSSPAAGLVGLEVDLKANVLATCSTEAVVQYWDAETASQKRVEIKAHAAARRMRIDPDNANRFAVGGDKCDLRIWDVNEPADAIFKAKNVAHDMLNLEVPVHVVDMAFLPNTDGRQIFVASAHRHLRMYDTRAQRRPVLNVVVGDHAYTTLQLLHNPNHAAVADGKGTIRMVDMRTMREIGSFKGHKGGVRCLALHPTQPYIATSSLDRYVRIFNINTHKSEYSFYMKQKLNAVAFTSELLDKTLKKPTADGQPAPAAQDDADDDDDYGTARDEEAEDDALWNSLRTVGEPPSKKSAKSASGKS